MFNKSTKIYQEAIDKSGYNYKLKFEEIEEKENVKKKRKIKINVIWYCPLFNLMCSPLQELQPCW